MSHARRHRLEGTESAAAKARPTSRDAVTADATSPELTGRRSSGQMTVDVLGDGTRAFRLRFRADARRERLTLHERRDCDCGCGGGWTDRTARVELENMLARVRAGVWQKPAAGPGRDDTRSAPPAAADLSRVRVLVAAGQGRRGDRPQAD